MYIFLINVDVDTYHARRDSIRKLKLRNARPYIIHIENSMFIFFFHRKIQAQHEQLDKEYRIHAAGVLLCNSRASGKVSFKDDPNGILSS